MRYRGIDYSVPTAYGHRDVVVKGFVDEVVILAGAEEIARHARSHEAGAFVFDPRHYLALIERKPGALDQAALPLGRRKTRPPPPPRQPARPTPAAVPGNIAT